MENRSYMLELPFYFEGMTDEDYLYITSNLSKRKDDILNKTMSGKIELPNPKTRVSIFAFLGLDLEYVFIPGEMC